ncbi:MAG: ATP-binding cassette domain-containing protein, partial [Pseudomonas sp.]
MFASTTASASTLSPVSGTTNDAEHPYLLEITNISKGFPGVVALDNVQLRVRPGSVLALMGENGAGKSTLMKIIAGIYQPD